MTTIAYSSNYYLLYVRKSIETEGSHRIFSTTKEEPWW